MQHIKNACLHKSAFSPWSSPKRKQQNLEITLAWFLCNTLLSPNIISLEWSNHSKEPAYLLASCIFNSNPNWDILRKQTIEESKLKIHVSNSLQPPPPKNLCHPLLCLGNHPKLIQNDKQVVSSQNLATKWRNLVHLIGPELI